MSSELETFDQFFAVEIKALVILKIWFYMNVSSTTNSTNLGLYLSWALLNHERDNRSKTSNILFQECPEYYFTAHLYKHGNDWLEEEAHSFIENKYFGRPGFQ